jgi:hypothetical protein
VFAKGLLEGSEFCCETTGPGYTALNKVVLEYEEGRELRR